MGITTECLAYCRHSIDVGLGGWDTATAQPGSCQCHPQISAEKYPCTVGLASPASTLLLMLAGSLLYRHTLADVEILYDTLCE